MIQVVKVRLLVSFTALLHPSLVQGIPGPVACGRRRSARGIFLVAAVESPQSIA
jgi:hypothetical protein